MFEAKSSDVQLSDDGMVCVSGLPVFRFVNGCMVFRDKDKQRSRARGGAEIKVRVIDLVQGLKR